MRAARIRRAIAAAVEVAVAAAVLSLVALILLNYIALAVVEGRSMEPTLQPGDLIVIVKRISPKDIAVGDVVVYRRGGTLIIHRVIRIEGDALITKGDNNWLPDPPVKFQAVLGKVLELGGSPIKVPLVGYLTLFIRYAKTSLTNLPVPESLDSVSAYSSKLAPVPSLQAA